MDNENGWIKVYRSIQQHWIWDDPDKLKWWIDLLLLASHKTTEFNIGMQLVTCKRGELVRSLSGLAKRWKISKTRVYNFLNLLQKANMVTVISQTKYTRIIICNYDSYQESQNDDRLVSDRYETDIRPLCDSYKNVKNVKNEKNIDTHVQNDGSFQVFWDLYGKKRSRVKVEKKWWSLKPEERTSIIAAVPAYVASTPKIQFRKDPLTYLNGRCWEDEIIPASVQGIQSNSVDTLRMLTGGK